MIKIISLTEQGQQLGRRIYNFYQQHDKSMCELWHKPQPFSTKIQQAFKQGDALLFICATGIVVRALASVIDNKYDDPPVLVMDELGQFVIPLLSGHEGGANQWAHKIAQYLDAQLVLTTAKSYTQPVYTIGMGCERGCPHSELSDLLMQCLQRSHLTLDNISNINSIDIKADEEGLLSCAATLDKPFQVFDKTSLAKVESLLSVKSDYVYKTVGVYGVAESAALVAAEQLTGRPAELVLNKVKTQKATCAIARSYY